MLLRSVEQRIPFRNDRKKSKGKGRSDSQADVGEAHISEARCGAPGTRMPERGELSLGGLLMLFRFGVVDAQGQDFVGVDGDFDYVSG